MNIWIPLFSFLLLAFFVAIVLWAKKDRRYESSISVSSAYDSWTNDRLLERLWGEHVHLGYYPNPKVKGDFREAKADFVHALVKWSGLDKLPKGSQVIDVGCGIGGSSRILAREYGFDVLGITISPEQVKRANELTPEGLSCRFEVMDALDLKFDDGSFDGVWSVEAGPHMPDKQRYADEMLRVLRPGGVLAVGDWNARDISDGKMSFIEKLVMRQLLDQWAHPEFSSIKGFQSNLLDSQFSAGTVETDDWTAQTLPSWIESIVEGVRRPYAVLGLGAKGLFMGLRETPTMLLMHWAFANGLMQFGVFRSRG